MTGSSWALWWQRIRALALVATILAGCSPAGPASTSPPAMSPAPSLSAHAEVTQDRFQVRFDVPKTIWRSDETLTGQAQLSFLGQGSTTISHMAPLFGFEVVEVGGGRKVEPLWAASCQDETISAGRPLSSGLAKSGGLDTPFANDFLRSSAFRLPPGTWDITAIAPFDPVACSLLESRPAGPRLEATIRVQVVAGPAST